VAAALLFGLDQPLTVEVEGQPLQARALIVAPDAEQSLQSDGDTLVVHLDPDSPLWGALAPRLQHGFARLPWAERQAEQIRQLRDCGDADRVRSQLAAMTAGDIEPMQIDPRVQALAARLRAELPERLDLNVVAAGLGLSAARLSRLFREAYGITPKRFLLHLKMQRVLHQWQPGMTATELAQAAGFYDQPHLIRTTREMFDVLPSAFLGNPDFRIIREKP
jgi:AraC family transcriptional regulator, arabinose operon regulatory protein